KFLSDCSSEVCSSDLHEINGSIQETDDDKVNLHTYNKALIDLEKLRKEGIELKEELEQKKSELSKIQINSGTTKVSKEYLQAEKLFEFSELLNNYLRSEEHTSELQ